MAATSEATDGYRAFHAPRFRYLAHLTASHLPRGGRRVLDIGLSPFTEILRGRVNAEVDTLGLEADGPGRRGHYSFDLNALAEASVQTPLLPQYDLIVFAEVLEHLHVAPELVLAFLWNHLVPGGILLVQTPNAASLGKRVKLALGRNPYEMIRSDRKNPGHFREYTRGELQKLAFATGFAVVAVDRRYYFDARFAHHQESGAAGTLHPVVGVIKNVVYSSLPGFLREGLTLVLRKESPKEPA
ncbi:MAG TPA: class I SAM-dependent methyltransferase [Vicinamibacterales bacterium]|jgi:SAM-dependent methyltransferase|nr:class I SAM-dependent methyltransferase [Vicinamibacterales bacterium]